MNKLLILFLYALATTSAVPTPDPFSDLKLKSNVSNEIDNKLEIAGRGVILDSQGKKLVKEFLKQLRTGWPDSGVPPLAPYTKDEMTFDINQSFLEFTGKITNFSIDGLDNAEIKQLNIHYTLGKRIKFNFLFPKIVIGGKLFTKTFRIAINENGKKFDLNGKADMELILGNITFQGQFKYTWPLIIFESIKIYKFDASLTLGNVVSKIDGLMGGGILTKLLNDQIEKGLMKYVSSNQDKISKKLEESLVPFVNSLLKGKNIWTIIG